MRDENGGYQRMSRAKGTGIQTRGIESALAGNGSDNRELGENTRTGHCDTYRTFEDGEFHVLNIIEFLPYATFAINRMGEVIAWNRAIEEVTGIKKEYMLGKGNYEYAVPMYGERRPVLIDLVLQPDRIGDMRYESIDTDGDALIASTYGVPHAGAGKGVWLRGKASPLYDRNGHIIGAIESFTDITNQRRVEKELYESEKRYREFFASLRDGFASVNMDGRIIETNPALQAVLGYTREELSHLTFREITPEKWHDSEEEIIQNQVLTRGYSDTYEKEYIRKDGSMFPVELRAHLIRDEHNDPKEMWGFVRDISRRKQAEDALLTSEKELREKSINLQEANTALKVLLNHIQEEKQTLQNTILENIRDLVLPYVQKLKKLQTTEQQATLIDIIESNLGNIVSPFMQKLTHVYSTFTPTEIQVANLVRAGKTTKEIAQLLHVSSGTVDSHRNSIRHKLGLGNKKINLRTHLLSL